MCATMDLLLLLVVILVAVLIWRGPKVLPEIGAALGKAVKGARDTADDETPEHDGRDDHRQPPSV
jgi:Sec-independent protein translocase protein TatA